MRSHRLAIVLLALAAATGAGLGAVQVPPTGVISGVVTDAATGRPIEGVLVEVSTPRRETLTDSDGHYVFADRPAGRYTLTAKHEGFFQGYFKIGQTALGDRTVIVLADNDKFPKADIGLVGVASLEGRVTDERSGPMRDVVVRVLISQAVSGQDRWFAGHATRTDARGNYSITNLQPGSYRVMLVSTQHTRAGIDPPASVYPQLFFPDVTRLSGTTPLELRASETRLAVDFTRRPAKVRTVSGRLLGPPDAYAGLMLRLVPDDLVDIGESGEAATTFVNPGGTFTFSSVPEGDYMLIADRARVGLVYEPRGTVSANLPAVPGLKLRESWSWGFYGGGIQGLSYSINRLSGPAYSGRQHVSVGSKDVKDIAIAMESTATLTLRVEPGGPGGLRILLDPVRRLGGLPFGGSAMATDDRPIEIDGIPPGEYAVHASALLQSAVFDGENALGRPIRIDHNTVGQVLSIRAATNVAKLNGIIRDDKGAIVPGANALVFPVDETLWVDRGFESPWIRASQATTAGDVVVNGILPGEYYVVGIPADRSLAWPSAGFLRSAKLSATKVKIVNDKTETVAITLATALPR